MNEDTAWPRCRPIWKPKTELTGETPVLPGIVSQFMAPMRIQSRRSQRSMKQAEN